MNLANTTESIHLRFTLRKVVALIYVELCQRICIYVDLVKRGDLSVFQFGQYEKKTQLDVQSKNINWMTRLYFEVTDANSRFATHMGLLHSILKL